MQSAGAQLIGDLVRQHADNADTGYCSLNGSHRRIDREFGARLDGKGRAVPAVAPFRRGRKALKAYAVMLAEVFRLTRVIFARSAMPLSLMIFRRRKFALEMDA